MEENIKVMPYFMIYTADFKTLKDKLSDKEIVEILNAISDLCLYAETDFVPTNKFQEIWFNKLKDDFLKNLSKYKSCIANGSKGGRPKKPKENPKETQTKPNGFCWDKPKQNPDETNKIKENIIKINNNIPTKQEVIDYCKLQGINIDIDSFYEFYSVNNWYDTYGKPANWKQKLITWKMNNKGKPKEQPAEEYASRYREL